MDGWMMDGWMDGWITHMTRLSYTPTSPSSYQDHLNLSLYKYKLPLCFLTEFQERTLVTMEGRLCSEKKITVQVQIFRYRSVLSHL